MITITVTTSNSHKLQEMNQIAKETGTDIHYQIVDSVFDSHPEIIENGVSFEENAAIKVMAYEPPPSIILLGEDSGLEVDGLDKRPGIHSARYGGPNATAADKCQLLLEELEGVEDRTARYVSAMALRLAGHDVQVCRGTVEGRIAKSMLGSNGFGYDPIFIPEGFDQSFGELPISVKHQLSHRYRAQMKIHDILASLRGVAQSG